MSRSSPKILKQLSAAEREKFLNSFDVVFCDCDGVVWYTLRDFIPGSAQALAELQRRGKRLTFVTNNSISSVAEHLHKFAQQAQLHVLKVGRPLMCVSWFVSHYCWPAGTDCASGAGHLRSPAGDWLCWADLLPGDAVVQAAAARCWLPANAGGELVGSGLLTAIQPVSFGQPEGVIIRSLAELREAIFGGEPVAAVIIDVDFNLTATKLMRAHIQLQNPNCLFLAGAADALIPFGDRDIIGPGPFIDVVAQSTGRQPTVLGKPGEALRQLLRQHHAHIPANRVLFIGDSLASDIGFARASGYQTLLVLTGGSSEADLAKLPAGHAQMPDYVADCLGDLCAKPH
ncbi:4-nitrophenylphosphatase isoform X2 [Drosophila hydei]|uniref:4-nitrophenylphosphatase isoform X2 n=1 Tax=Drosophila hydei TaxID=7224 RepID=A0A6J1LD29_DROHY|nr:4-nitrophenylphosphatase isoform X2 [Drosophila hydei]